MSDIRSSEQRHHVRYRPKDSLFVTIQGVHSDNPACIVDLNRSGIGFYSSCMESKLSGKFIVLDLMSRNRAILRSLSAKVVFAETLQNKKDPDDALQRYGLQFVNLSILEKRQIDLIISKYALLE